MPSAEYYQAQRAMRISKGLCTYCGRIPANEGRKLCEHCNSTLKAKRRARRKVGGSLNERDKEYQKRRYHKLAAMSPEEYKAYVNRHEDKSTHTDHIIPVAYLRKAYPNDERRAMRIAESAWNLRKIPASENLSKGSKMTDEAWDLCREHGIPIIEWHC